jgi:O-antigen/teichoic acid export membrane protein
LCFPIYAGVAVAAAPLITTLFGDRWTDSAPVLTLFGVAGIPLSLSYMHGATLKAAAATRGFFVIQLALAVVYLPGLLVVVSHGILVATTTYLVALCVVLPVEVWMMKIAIGISVGHYVRALKGPLAATSVMVALTFGVGELARHVSPPLRLVIEAVTGLTSYLLALRVLAPATFQRLRKAVLALRRRR